MEGAIEVVGFSAHAKGVIERADGSYSDDGMQVDLSQMDPSRFTGPSYTIGGEFFVECYDADGNLKWSDTAKNSVTLAGLDDVNNTYLNDQSPSATWYIGLVDNASFSAFAGADTSASHAGWLENTNYSNSTRPAWGNGSSSSQVITNASTVNFSITATVTIRGAFLINNSTKGGTTGMLWCTAAFTSGNQACNNGDTLKVTYTVTASTS